MQLNRRSFMGLVSSTFVIAALPSLATLSCGYSGCTAKYAPQPNRRMKRAIRKDYKRFYRLTVSQQARYQRYLAK